MAATWVVILSLGAVVTGSLAAVVHTSSTTPFAKNITSQSNVSHRPSSQAEPRPLRVPGMPLLSSEQQQKQEGAELMREGGDVALNSEVAKRGSLAQQPSLPTPGDDDDDDDDDGNEEYGRDEDGRMEYEELPVAMAQTDVGYTRSDGTYIVNDKDGRACILAYFKSKATIYYADAKGDYKPNQVSPAEGATVSGSCDRVGKVSQLDVHWSSYTLSLLFGLDEPTDSWFVSRFRLTYNLSSADFVNAAPGGVEVTAVSKARNYWQTSNSFSFRCLLLHDVQLTDDFNNTAILHFDEVRVQAFSSGDTFRTPKHCIHRAHRDEMVPVTVGAVLAGSTILTIIGYSIFRYFKVKKVQYDTME